MVAATFFPLLLHNPWFRTFITGSGFFADSYDLFIVDGVTNILKNLAANNAVTYEYFYNGSK